MRAMGSFPSKSDLFQEEKFLERKTSKETGNKKSREGGLEEDNSKNREKPVRLFQTCAIRQGRGKNKIDSPKKRLRPLKKKVKGKLEGIVQGSDE